MKYNPIDKQFIDEELDRFFHALESSGKPKTDVMFKYRKRFYNQKNKVVSFKNKRRTEHLSLGKKLEILCTYADFTLTKKNK